MLVSRLLRSLLQFCFMGIVPDEGGGAAAPEPVVDAAPAGDTPPADEPALDITPPPAPEPGDPFAALTAELDKLTADPKPAAKEPAPPKPAEPKPDDKPEAKDVDLTPPEGMSERATQRWSQLTERAKLVPQLEQRATQAETQLESVRNLVAKSGMDANEFSDMLEVARLLKSTSAEEGTKAIARLDAIRAEVAQRFGIEVAGLDPLDAHPDLKKAVEDMTVPREFALEQARLRAAARQAEGVNRQQQDYNQHVTSVNTARDEMATALAARKGTPGHDAKMAYIGAFFQDQAKLAQFVKTYQPAQWKDAALMMYDIYTPPAAAPVPAGPQPLRPGSVRPGPAVVAGPVTAQSAIENALAQAGL